MIAKNTLLYDVLTKEKNANVESDHEVYLLHFNYRMSRKGIFEGIYVIHEK